MKQITSILCLILLVLSICANNIITVSATEITSPTMSTIDDSQLENEDPISIEDICEAFSRLVNKGKQWVETQKERIPEEVIQILKVLRVAQRLFQD